MKKWKSNLFPAITLAVCLGLAACGVGRKPLEITVVNRTTYPVETSVSEKRMGKIGERTAWRQHWPKAKALRSIWENIRWKNWTEVFRFSFTVRMKSR